jgi:tetratricopeptide (TPR) repeat protein
VIWSSIFRRPTWASLILLLALPLHAPAQNPASSSDASSDAASATSGRLVLVLPFENRSGQPNLQWIGDSFPDTINQRLNSAGFLTITRDDRQFALDHLGFPVDFRPTRATTIRIAQTLDADYVVLGSYNVQNGVISTQARVLAVNKLSLSQPLEDSSQLARLFDIENAIAWKVARQIDPNFSVAEQTFLAASGQVRLSAFENYIRGISSTASPTASTGSSDRIKRLQAAVLDEPNYAAALLALGKAQYADRAYSEAAATLAKMPRGDRLALEANFYLGLARFNSAKYADAESAFAFVASRLPLPEVVNNQGVAASRQGKDAVALFQRAATADPNDADYHFNLAVAYLNRGDAAAITRELDTALKLRPSDPEASDLRARVAAAHLSGPSLKAAVETGGFEPLERIRRTYSEASFRQAAFQMDQMRAARLATLPPAQQATEYTQQGRDYLAQGLIPEAEIELQAALTANPRSEAAHAGLAQVREQSGDPDSARREANTSIQLKPNVPAYLVLARLDLQANHPDASAGDVRNALRLEPTNSAALGMKQALLARGQVIP